ncbi:hypothetical protein UT4_20750 [Ferrigenium sp. UT4]
MSARNLLVCAVMVIACTACNLAYLDKPSPYPWEYYWTKKGLDNNQIRDAYYRCGYTDKGWTMLNRPEFRGGCLV